MMNNRLLKKTLVAAAAIAAAFMLTACFPEHKQGFSVNSPDFSSQGTKDLDFVQLHNDIVESFANAEAQPYSFISDFDTNIDWNGPVVVFSAKAFPGTGEEELKRFAAAVLSNAGYAAFEQYGGYEPSSPQSFGSFFNDYGIRFTITNEMTGEELYGLQAGKGEAIPLDPDVESYEEEWLEEYYELLAEEEEDEE